MLQHVSRYDTVSTPRPAMRTDDPLKVLRFAVAACEAGLAVALVTLIAVRGGSARPPGAQMAVREDGLWCGVVSGGCVEAAAAHEALAAIAEGRDREVIYGQGSPWMDIVLPCGGSITLAIHPLRSLQPLQAVLAAIARREQATLRYARAGQTLTCLHGERQTGQEDGAFDIAFRPCPRLVMFGRTVAIDVTARIARAAGFEVEISDGARPADVQSQIDRDTAVILLYHDLLQEAPLLRAALDAPPFYIGALGSYRTHQQRVAMLRQQGYDDGQIARIKAPVGIFPKARDATSLALSILADIAAARQETS